jgi:hypothetical protein
VAAKIRIPDKPKLQPYSSQTIETDVLIAISHINHLKETRTFRGERIGRIITTVFGCGSDRKIIFYHPGDIVVYAPDASALQPDKIVIETPLNPSARERGNDPRTIRNIPVQFVEEINNYSMPAR